MDRYGPRTMTEPETSNGATNEDPFSPLLPANLHGGRRILFAVAGVTTVLALISVVLRSAPGEDVTNACRQVALVEVSTLEAALPASGRISELLSSGQRLARDGGDRQLADALNDALRGLVAGESNDLSYQRGQAAAMFSRGVVEARSRCADLVG